MSLSTQSRIDFSDDVLNDWLEALTTYTPNTTRRLYSDNGNYGYIRRIKGTFDYLLDNIRLHITEIGKDVNIIMYGPSVKYEFTKKSSFNRVRCSTGGEAVFVEAEHFNSTDIFNYIVSRNDFILYTDFDKLFAILDYAMELNN